MTRPRPTRKSEALLALALALGAAFVGSRPRIARAEEKAAAATCHTAHGAAAASEPAAPRPEVVPEVVTGRLEIPDLELTDQDGKPVRFYSDLVAGRLVAMNFIFTTCTTICPPMGANFAKLERILAQRQGTPVALISVSIDPATDTPARLKAWRDNLQGGGKGQGGSVQGGGSASSPWTLVTGPRQEMTALLKALNAFNADKARHTPFLLLGNEATGQWRRVYGLTPPAELVKLLDELATTTVAKGVAP